ncbi:MAG: hypothetical protein KGH76_00855 [Thaumarchaeota archaeon]|nr:hypothetical protein [Nitrososphaerota archaeon]
MDFDGILQLVEKDRLRFKEWLEESGSFTLAELNAGYNKWLEHYNTTYAKYKDLEADNDAKNISLLAAKLMYFNDLTNFAMHALTIYTTKLKEEYNALKDQSRTNIKKTKTVKKRKR